MSDPEASTPGTSGILTDISGRSSGTRPAALHSFEMRPLRYSINVTLDGCCDHRAIPADEDLHRHAVENLNQADALLFGRVTYEMMESAWRPPRPAGVRPGCMAASSQSRHAAEKDEVQRALQQLD